MKYKLFIIYILVIGFLYPSVLKEIDKLEEEWSE